MIGFVALGLAASLLTLVVVEAGCPPGFTNYNMGCYYIGTIPVRSANGALETCYDMGGYLLNINAELENNYAMDIIAKQGKLYDGYWIGGFYNGKYWMWQWIDAMTGREVDEFMNPQAGYYAWGPFQPDDGLGPIFAQYHLAIMVRGKAVPYKWYSENERFQSTNGMSFICEADWKE